MARTKATPPPRPAPPAAAPPPPPPVYPPPEPILRVSAAPKGKYTPAEYRSAKIKVTSLFVAFPILFVTSYMLYNRLVLGEEQKRVGLDPMPKKVGMEGIVAGKGEEGFEEK